VQPEDNTFGWQTNTKFSVIRGRSHALCTVYRQNGFVCTLNMVVYVSCAV